MSIFRRLLRNHGGEPRKIVTDKLRSYGVAHRKLIPDTIHSTEQYENHRGSSDVWPENGFTSHFGYRTDYQWRRCPAGIFQHRNLKNLADALPRPDTGQCPKNSTMA